MTNPVHRGLTRHKDKTWPGTHAAIVDKELWEQVQDKLQAASARRRGSRNAPGARTMRTLMRPSSERSATRPATSSHRPHTQRHGRRLRYDVSNRLLAGMHDTGGWHLPAPAIELAVTTAFAYHLGSRARSHGVLSTVTATDAEGSETLARSLAHTIRQRGPIAIAPASLSGSVSAVTLRIALDRLLLADHLGLVPSELDADLLEIAAPFT